MPIDRFTTQTYKEAYLDPRYDLEAMRIPTEIEVNNAIKLFLNQIESKKKGFNESLGVVQSFLDEPKVSIEKLDKFIESINNLIISGNSLLGLIDSYLDYYNTYGRYSTQVSVYHLEVPKIKLKITNALLELEKIKKRLIKSYANKHASRVELDVDNTIDWDESPTIYQATTIAHGHILCFRMRWKADGYSLGEVKYSKSLGPCEKEQVAILDWSRSESSSRLESTISRENFSASFSRDRDVNEVISASLNESIKGKSIGVTAGAGGGASFGGSLGGNASASGTDPSTGISGKVGLKGGLGGMISSFTSIGVSGSVASQKATRSMSSNLHNKLRDRINQSAQAVRSQRSVVIQSVSQNERVSATTKVIANKNLCHSVNYLFFEILKHYAIEQEIVDVRECLFIPMKITAFDAKKAIRWKHILQPIMPTKDLWLGFEALQNIENNTPSPNGVLANEPIQDFFGQLKISFDIPLPSYDDAPDEDISTWDQSVISASNWPFWYNNFLERPFGGGFAGFYHTWFWKRRQQEKIKTWEERFVPIIVQDFVEDLQIVAMNGNIEIPLNIDVSQISKYRKSVSLDISLNISENTPNIRRSDIKKIKIYSSYQVPNNARIILQSGALSYRSKSLNEFVFLNNSIRNDMVNNDSVVIITPMNERELTNPALQELERANQLLTFLNDHLTEMHQFIFAGMNHNTRFMMLDGIKLNAAGGRSVSSLVENDIVDIVGNSIVMPVASGLRIDPVFRSQDNLLDIYKPKDKVEPFRVSLPTGGYFMEAVQGSCNACEELDYTKARFHGFGCTDEPTPIQELSTDTRRTDPGNLQAKDLPASIVNFQNVPQAPNPTDLNSVLTLLGKGDSFRDLSGLTENQKNALAALVKNADSALAMGQMTADMVKTALAQNVEKTIDRDLGRIDDQLSKGNITKEDAQELSKKALENKNKLNESTSEEKTDSKIQEAVESANKSIEKGANKAKVKETRKDGTTTEVEIVKDRVDKHYEDSLNDNYSPLSSYVNDYGSIKRNLVGFYKFPDNHIAESLNTALNFLSNPLNDSVMTDELEFDENWLTDISNQYSSIPSRTMKQWLSFIGTPEILLKKETNQLVSAIFTPNQTYLDKINKSLGHPSYGGFELNSDVYYLNKLLLQAEFKINTSLIDTIEKAFLDNYQTTINQSNLKAVHDGLSLGYNLSTGLELSIPVKKLIAKLSASQSINADYVKSIENVNFNNISVVKKSINKFALKYKALGIVNFSFIPYAEKFDPTATVDHYFPSKALTRVHKPQMIPVVYEIEEIRKELSN
jgi:hypothetical protein